MRDEHREGARERQREHEKDRERGIDGGKKEKLEAACIETKGHATQVQIDRDCETSDDEDVK